MQERPITGPELQEWLASPVHHAAEKAARALVEQGFETIVSPRQDASGAWGVSIFVLPPARRDAICPLCTIACNEPMECMGTLGHPKVGTRFELVTDVDRFDSFIAPKGMRGTLIPTQNGPEDIYLLMDDHVDGCEDWQNELIWIDDHETAAAVEELRLIHEPPKCMGAQGVKGEAICEGPNVALYFCQPIDEKAAFYAHYCEDCAALAHDENKVEKVAEIVL